MKTKNEYIEILATELRELSGQIDELTAKTEAATAQAKLEYAQDLEALRTKRQVAVEKIQELEAHGGEAWDELKDTAEMVWSDLRTGLASVVAKFK